MARNKNTPQAEQRNYTKRTGASCKSGRADARWAWPQPRLQLRSLQENVRERSQLCAVSCLVSLVSKKNAPEQT